MERGGENSAAPSIRFGSSRFNSVRVCITLVRVPDGRFDLDLLDDEEPFEIDRQAAHLFKHAELGIEDVWEVWRADPLFYPAKPLAPGSWWPR